MKRILVLLIGALATLGTLLAASHMPTQAQSDDRAANVAVVQRLYDELSVGNVAVILASYAPTVTIHYAGDTAVVAVQALHDELAARKAANPDLHAEIHNIFAQGDLVITELTWMTTHTGDYFGLPATGRTSEHPGIVVRRLVDGKIVESWEMFDDLAFLHSLGYSGDWAAISAQPPTICRSAFEATVQQGPSAGLTLTGTLSIVVKDDGGLDGQLTLVDGSRIATVGQANGRAINLMLTTPDGQAIFGVGTTAQPISQCNGLFGGPFVGPLPGDSGDWVGEATDDKEPPPDDGASTSDGDDEQLKPKGKPGKGVLN
jgi:steroid delta-isomerase-like uncharacterized protein